MSRFSRPEAIVARARSLLSDRMPRSVIDAFVPETYLSPADPECDQHEPPVVSPALVLPRLDTQLFSLDLTLDEDEASTGIEVECEEMDAAIISVAIVVACPSCYRRALYPKAYWAQHRPPLVKCQRCGIMLSVEDES